MLNAHKSKTLTKLTSAEVFLNLTLCLGFWAAGVTQQCTCTQEGNATPDDPDFHKSL